MELNFKSLNSTQINDFRKIRLFLNRSLSKMFDENCIRKPHYKLYLIGLALFFV